MPPRSTSTPSRFHPRTRQHSNPPPAAYTPSTSRPGTPSHGHSHSQSHHARGDIPSRKSTRPASPTPHDSSRNHSREMADAQPGTPTPRQPRRRRGGGAKSSQQRNPLPPSAADVEVGTDGLGLVPAVDGVDKDGEGSASTSEDELALFDILGVVSPPRMTPSASASCERQPGVIVLPQGQTTQPQAESNKKKKNKRGGKAQAEKTQAQAGALAPSRKQGGGASADEKGTVSEGDVSGKPAKNRSGTKPGTMLPPASGKASESASPAAGTPARDNGSAAEQPAGGKLDQLLALVAAGMPPKPEPAAKTGKGKKGKATPPVQRVQDGDEVFETKGLSQSLPVESEGLGQVKKGKGKGGRNGEKVQERERGESDVWDMPDVAGGQELTWQQKLQASSETPTRRAKSSTKANKTQAGTSSQGTTPAVSSPLANRPAHARQVSLDSIPLPALQPFQQQPQPPPHQRLSSISAFDGFIPFHTGFNVHRAPQTPAKSVAGLHGNLLPASGPAAPPGKVPGSGGGGDLPLIPGEFPRIKGATAVAPYIGFEGKTRSNGSSGAGMGGGAGSGPKYAGPTFHNSPHAATLAKPDMEDF
ncbi:hypothetical protein IAT38_001520 [Cryptococcus sp. DSM 104549]